MVYSIRYPRISKLVQMDTLGWTRYFLLQGQICFLKFLYERKSLRMNFLETIEVYDMKVGICNLNEYMKKYLL